MANIEKGTVFGDRYIVQSQVGTGGMATVYRGIDNVLDRPVAIKVMLPQYANDPAFAQRFKQEAQAAAALQNPYIVQVYDWGRDNATGTYYIVMEYLRGTDLKTGIRSHGALAPRKVAQIGAQVCSALSVAHAHDIIHRDIKPQNIMIQPSGDAKVMDFGIARAKNSHLTQTNSVLGTAHYVSPEQAQGKELDATSDLYSLGVVMYEAATGKLPFDGDDAVSVALKQVNEQAVPPSQVNPNVDNNLEAIIMRCMDKNPRQRFQSADELRHVLNNYINGRPIGLTPTSGAGTTTRLADGRTATQVMRPGETGRTTVQPARTAATQRMNRPGGTVPPRGTGTAGARGTTPGRGRINQSTAAPSGSRAGVIVGVVVAVLIVVILAIVLSLTMCGGNTNPNPTEPNNPTATTGKLTTVPDLANYTQQEATNRLRSNNLELGNVVQEQSATVAVGKIIRQDPAANTEVEEGTKVTIYVSSGSDKVMVTNILGKTEEEAKQILTQQGFTPQYDSTMDAHSDQYPEGTVVAYSPANQQVAKGATVKYGLSKGVDPATLKATVPWGLTGAWYEDAIRALADAELGYSDNWVYDNNVGYGTVISVDPSEGSEVDKGTEVLLRVSNGPEPVTIGAYYGWSGDAAQQALSDLGLYSSINNSEPAPDAGSVGLVYATDPRSGTQVQPGSSVIVYIYGSYTPPAPTTAVVPDVSGSSVHGAVTTLYDYGFNNVTVTDGEQIISSDNYDNYSIDSVSNVGNDVPFGTEIVIRVSPK